MFHSKRLIIHRSLQGNTYSPPT